MDAESPEDLPLSQSLEQLQKALSQATKDYILGGPERWSLWPCLHAHYHHSSVNTLKTCV